MVYCTTANVRLISNISTAQISDPDLQSIIDDFAIGLVNSHIATEWRDERIRTISNEKENDINGTNTTFYTRHTPLCDLDDDGDVDSSDVEVYSLDSEGTRATLTVDSIDDSWIGKFSLDSAPAGNLDVFIKKYRSANVDVTTPHPMVRLACSLAATMFGVMRIEAGQYGSWRDGKVSMTKKMPAFKTIEFQFNTIVGILKNPIRLAHTGEQTKRIKSFFERDIGDVNGLVSSLRGV